MQLNINVQYGIGTILEWKAFNLILDHINGKNHDNRLDNLRWVCPNCNIQLPTTNRRKKAFGQKYNFCIDCGKKITSKSLRCVECAQKYRKDIAKNLNRLLEKN